MDPDGPRWIRMDPDELRWIQIDPDGPSCRAVELPKSGSGIAVPDKKTGNSPLIFVKKKDSLAVGRPR